MPEENHRRPRSAVVAVAATWTESLIRSAQAAGTGPPESRVRCKRNVAAKLRTNGGINASHQINYSYVRYETHFRQVYLPRNVHNVP